MMERGIAVVRRKRWLDGSRGKEWKRKGRGEEGGAERAKCVIPQKGPGGVFPALHAEVPRGASCNGACFEWMRGIDPITPAATMLAVQGWRIK